MAVVVELIQRDAVVYQNTIVTRAFAGVMWWNQWVKCSNRGMNTVPSSWHQKT